MSTIRSNTVVPLTGQADVNLAPFDRFGGRGGRVSVKATGVSAEANGDLTMTVLVGSDILTNEAVIGSEAIVNLGPNNETPAIKGFGAPADPITVRLFNANAAARTVTTEVEVENA